MLGNSIGITTQQTNGTHAAAREPVRCEYRGSNQRQSNGPANVIWLAFEGRSNHSQTAFETGV